MVSLEPRRAGGRVATVAAFACVREREVGLLLQVVREIVTLLWGRVCARACM